MNSCSERYVVFWDGHSVANLTKANTRTIYCVLVFHSSFRLKLGLSCIIRVASLICLSVTSVLFMGRVLICILLIVPPSFRLACWRRTTKFFTSWSSLQCPFTRPPKFHAVSPSYVVVFLVQCPSELVW